MDDFILGEIDKIKDFFMGNGRCSAKAVYEELKQEIEEQFICCYSIKNE